MPFSSQFSLSLELTNLIPIPRRITDRVSAGVSELLTAIVRSGSDPETERLTMEVFGRNTIERGMERTFREVTQFSTKRTILQQSLDIVLDAGAGPTVQRAFESPQYLATVIQLSMLSWALGSDRHDRLAQALAESMRLRLEGAPPQLQAYPEKNGLTGFIKACEEQSCTFPWQRFFDAVQAKLGLQSQEIGPANHDCYRLNVRILQSCLDMFTAVQLSPEQRMLRIECREGVVTLVVWAHCLLGLAVVVSGSPNGTVYFGDGDEPRIFIHIGDFNTKSGACLLDSAEEIVFVLDADDTQTIFGEWKHPAKGYGMSVLRNELDNHIAVTEMVHVIAVLALWICQCLDERQESPCRERDNIISAMNFVFDGVELDSNRIQEYFPHYARKRIDDTLPAPRGIASEFRQTETATIGWWSNLITKTRCLALLVLALSCVHELEPCEQWRLGSLTYLDYSVIGGEVKNWNGIAELPFHHDTWYDVLCRMMRFDVTVSYCDENFLFSKGGWSIYMSSFGDFDPFAMPPGLLIVKPGVPTSLNDGERRHQLVDDPVWAFQRFGGRWKFSWQCKEKAGESTWPKCETSAEELALRSYTGKGQNPDAFVVAVGYGNSRLYSGYQEMHQKRSEVHLLRTCGHSPNRPIVLPKGTATGTAIFGVGVDKSVPRICISLVRGSVGGRWLTVLSSEEGRRIALTMGHVCLECAIDQTLKLGGNWFIVC